MSIMERLLAYNFSKNKRPVVNRISAQFYFQDGLIIDIQMILTFGNGQNKL
jgi:hypothetical protein